MEKHDWNAQLDYLKSTRSQLWNDDYFEFLVKIVWKLQRPLRIVDFGCGYGYLGMKLLPMLPKGSTYTGIDRGANLLSEARRFFEHSPFHTEFIHADLKDYIPETQYDLAICQAVLRHIPQPETILKKMVDSVLPGGKVIRIEVNRKMEQAGLYLPNDPDLSEKEYALKRQWEDELRAGGRDYRLGIKVPLYMERLGLKNISVRVNDFVEFISPEHDGDQYSVRAERFLRLRGLPHGCADNPEAGPFIHARGLLISCGTR